MWWRIGVSEVNTQPRKEIEMSTFGDNTFKQNILDEILYHSNARGLDKKEIAMEVLEVVQYILGGWDYSQDVYEKALEDAKAEILAKLS
jgi:ADP-dependent phosphofructokinase/glucokinase